ncbi:hypothetical protein INR49_024469 [Caranx melampygus]|nr:hypothetical protein INR49_024469 [Caranx melampygus]
MAHQRSWSVSSCLPLRVLQLTRVASCVRRWRRKCVTQRGHQCRYGAEQAIQAGAKVQQGSLERGAEGGAGQLPDSCQQHRVGPLVLGQPGLVLQAVPQLQAGGSTGQDRAVLLGRGGEKSFSLNGGPRYLVSSYVLSIELLSLARVCDESRAIAMAAANSRTSHMFGDDCQT